MAGASSSSSTSAPLPHSNDDNDDSLHPGCYTAHRLHHATPPHLHLTSRRVFVGPLPVGWLKNHRTDWYKQHLHYSKRQSSFSAQPNTLPMRRTTGLDRPRYQEESRDNGDNDDDDMGDTTPEPRSLPVAIPSMKMTRSSSSTPTIIPSRRQREKEREGQIRDSETSPLSSPQTDLSLTPPALDQLRPETADTDTSLATARTRPRTVESLGQPTWVNRGESFATAHESWERNEGHRLSMERKNDEEEVPPIATMSSFADDRLDESMTTNHSQAGASTISAQHSIHGQDSLASLLKKGRGQRRLSDSVDSRLMNLDGPSDSMRRPVSSKRTSILSLGRKEKTYTTTSMQEVDPTPWTAPNTRVSTYQKRVTGGLVHFNTSSDKPTDRNVQRQATDLSRARSLRQGGRRRSSFGKQGEIIKMESMLVRVETAQAQQLPEEYDENESLKFNTRTADKWREYVVVCRETDDPDISMVLRLYKTRTIPAIDKPHVSSRSARDIPLNPKTTRANLYSSLDKTLVIWLPYKRGTLIYIMRPRCSSSSVEWYTFLRTALGEKPGQSLQISVPDLTLTILIDNPFERVRHTEENTSGDITVIEPSAVACLLLKQSMRMLEGVNEWRDIIEHWKNNERMGLAWRRYDRLEWVHGANEQRMDGSMAMQKTHELELRPKKHYPTESLLNSGEKMVEPPPIEGFLIRLTSGKGREERLGRFFHKRLYFASHDQFLCFCRPSRALPPAPPKHLSRGGAVPTANEIADGIPLIYSVSPYALNEHGEIPWLTNPTPGFTQRKDQEAYQEAERKVNLLSRAEGFVDLTKAAAIRRVGSVSDETVGNAQGDAIDEHSEDPTSDVEADDEKCFEIVQENGLVLKLQAFDAQTRDEWILRLGDLIRYWKARHRADLAIVRRTRDMNLKQLNMDEEMESVMGQFGRKWEVSRTIASSELYNVCGISSCRTITMSGLLYRKPRRHATFRRYNVMLCNGELLIFHHSYRSRTGTELATIYHEKHLSLSLHDCYIYSGLVTTSDLLYQNQTFDSNAPGRHSLPRIYPDGYTSQDEDSMTCFVLWRGSRRTLFTKLDEDGKRVRKRVTPLGATGKAVVFKARSRLERDTWVMSIAMEIERLNSGVGDEINVLPPKY